MRQPNPRDTHIQLLNTRPATKQDTRRCLERLKEAENFQVKGSTVIHCTGAFVSAVAQWRNPICLDDGHTKARFAIIAVTYQSIRYTFAIPATLVDKRPAFPGLPFSESEVALIYNMADELRRPKDLAEVLVTVKPQEREDIKASRNLAQTLPADEATVANVIENQPWVLEVMEAALLANLRWWMDQDFCPMYLTTFVAPKDSSQATHTALTQLLSACTFTAPTWAPQLPQLTANTIGDLERWESAGCRVTLLTAHETARERLLRQGETLALSRLIGGNEVRFEGQPLLFARGKYPSAMAWNISLPQSPPAWSNAKLDAIRAFVGELLAHPKHLAKRMVCQYRQRTEGATGYRITTMEAWREVAEAVIQEGLEAYSQAVANARRELFDQAQQTEQCLKNAVALMLDPTRYIQQIAAQWPENETGVRVLLEEDQAAVALYKKTSKSEFLSFTKESLTRLCGRVGLPEEDNPLLIERLKTLGIISTETTPTKLKDGKTMRLIRIYCKHCASFTVSAVSPTKEELENG